MPVPAFESWYEGTKSSFWQEFGGGSRRMRTSGEFSLVGIRFEFPSRRFGADRAPVKTCAIYSSKVFFQNN